MSYNLLLSELEQTEPQSVYVTLRPYNETDDLLVKIQTTYNTLQTAILMNERIETLVYSYYLGELIITCPPRKKNIYRTLLTTHYIIMARKTYQIFNIMGIEQIYRTTHITAQRIQTVTRPTIQLLRNAATALLISSSI
jgi:hypothetical protein